MLAAIEDRAARAIIVSRSGRWADVRLHDRGVRNPLNLVLDTAGTAVGRPITLYWAYDGAPEMYCLTDLSELVIAYSDQYLTLSAFLRSLLVEAHVLTGDLLVTCVEQACLQAVADFALARGDADLACAAALRSLVELDGVRVARTGLEDLEVAAIGPSYMAVWFFGLLHEVGHLDAEQALRSGAPVESFHRSVGAVLEGALRAVSLPAPVRAAALSEIRRPAQQRSSLGPSLVGAEVLSDAFAISALLHTTVDIMEDLDQAPRGTDAVTEVVNTFAWEVAAAINVVALLERCKTAASVAADPAPSDGERERILAHPVAMATRSHFARDATARNLARWVLREDAPSADELERWRAIVDPVADSVMERAEAFEAGLARALTFTFAPAAAQRAYATRMLRTLQGRTLLTSVIELGDFTRRARTAAPGHDLLTRLAEVQP